MFKQPTPHSAHNLPADSPTSQQSQQDRKRQAVKTQSDLLMMGVKTPRNMLRNNWLPVKSLIVASSWSHLCLLGLTFIYYVFWFVFVALGIHFVALVIQHAMRISSSVACLSVPYFSTLPHKRYYFRKRNLLYTKCVFGFP